MTSHSEQQHDARWALLSPEQQRSLEAIRAGKHVPAKEPPAVTPPSAPAIAPELRNPDETAAEHIRNAATIVALCNIGLAGSLVLTPQDAEALRSRLRAALAKLEG